MELTQNYDDMVIDHARENAAFRAALVQEAAQNLIDGDLDTALGQLRAVVNATAGLDSLAERLHMSKEDLRDVLDGDAVPGASAIVAVLRAVGRSAGIHIVVSAEPAHEDEAA